MNMKSLIRLWGKLACWSAGIWHSQRLSENSYVKGQSWLSFQASGRWMTALKRAWNTIRVRKRYSLIASWRLERLRILVVSQLVNTPISVTSWSMQSNCLRKCRWSSGLWICRPFTGYCSFHRTDHKAWKLQRRHECGRPRPPNSGHCWRQLPGTGWYSSARLALRIQACQNRIGKIANTMIGVICKFSM